MSLEQCSMHLHLPRSRETSLWTFLLFAMLRGPHRLWRILNLCHYQGGSLNLTPPYLSEILQKSIANQGFRRDLGMKIQPSGKQRCVINFQKYQIEYDRQKTLCNICFIKNYVEVVHLFLIRIICEHRDKVKPEIKIHIVDQCEFWNFHVSLRDFFGKVMISVFRESIIRNIEDKKAFILKYDIPSIL